VQKFVVVLLVAGVLAVVAWQSGWFARQPGGASKEAPSVEVVRADIAPVLSLSGEVAPALQVEVKPEIGGRIRTIHVSTGDTVQKGQLLITIDDTDLRTDLAAARSEIEGARLRLEKNRGNYERARRLYERQLLSREEFVNLEADFQIAENDLEKAQRKEQTVQDKISKTRIPSPMDGQILDVLVNEGQVVVAAASVNSGTTLVNVADLSRLLINAHVNQLDAGRLATGGPLSINPPEPEATPVEGRISFIAPLATVKNNIKGFEVSAEIVGPAHMLKPGVSVAMKAPVGEAKDVLAAPITAVFRDGDSKVAYVKHGQDHERRAVETGLSDTRLVEIRSGLHEGELVLTVEPEKASLP
jgi:RND family efflux transporter MFP subunit